jgi:hypothetical protein
MAISPLDRDFGISLLPDRPAIAVIFRPTNSHYEFGVVTDREERARVGPISPSYKVRHQKTGDLGPYSDSEVLDVAVRLASATAEKILRGS